MPYGYSSLKIQLLNILINKIKENNQGRIYREKIICDISLWFDDYCFWLWQ